MISDDAAEDLIRTLLKERINVGKFCEEDGFPAYLRDPSFPMRMWM